MTRASLSKAADQPDTRHDIRFSSLKETQQRVDRSPFPLGEAPFRIKGVAFRTHFEHWDASVRGGRQAVIAAMEPALRAFFERPIIASDSYDLYALAIADGVAATLANRPYNEYVFEGAENAAEYDLRGAYKLILRVFSPQQIMERVCKVSALYFNVGTIAPVFVEGKQARIRRRDFPAPLFPWLVPVTEGYMKVAVSRTGVKNLTIHTETFPPSKELHGVALSDSQATYTWT